MADANSAEDVLKQLRGNKADYLKVSTDKVLLDFFGKKQQKRKNLEHVEFSDSVLKINKKGKEQERSLVITNLAIYNFIPMKFKKAKREIPISKLKGVALSKLDDEFLFQVKDDYDYRFRIVRRAEVVEIVSKYYEKLNGTKLKSTFVDDLDKVQVLKKEVKAMKIARESACDLDDDAEQKSDVKTNSNASRRGSESFNEEEKPVEGWLAKCGSQANSKWKRRFFRLGGSALHYYEARTKGSVVATAGAVRPWKNNRFDIVAREANEPSTPRHLKEIFSDPDRRDAFLKYCSSIYAEENANFYVAVDEFKLLNPTQHLQRALSIYERFIVNGAPNEISAPPQAREEVDNLIADKSVSVDMFDELQRIVASIMRIDLLPQYLDYAKQRLAKHDYSVKVALNDEDKKVERCNCCTGKFSLMRRKTFCQHCNHVFCTQCVYKQCELPPEFGHDTELFNVCDMCHGILTHNNDSAQRMDYAFSFGQPSRQRPLNLAAENASEQLSWINAIRRTIELYKSKSKSPSVSHNIVHVTHSESGPAEDPDAYPHLEGWLWKQDPTTLTWRRRFFVLDNHRLWYYEMKQKSYIPVTQGLGCNEVTASDEDDGVLSAEEATYGGFRSLSNFAFRFDIIYDDRVYQVAADTKQDRQYWLDSIKGALAGDKAIKEVVEDEEAIYAKHYHEKAPEGQVTFVFTDVQNSTKLWESVPDEMNIGLEIHDLCLRELLATYNGYEVKTEGDAFMVTFHNVLDAIRWCIAVQRELLKRDWPAGLLKMPAARVEWGKNPGDEEKDPVFCGIRIRMGIHTGEPSCRRNPVTGRMDYFGSVVNRAARVADSGHGGQIVCTEEVRAELQAALDEKKFYENVSIEKLGSFPYKGISTLVDVHQITPTDLAGRTPFPALRIHHELPDEKDPKEEAKNRLPPLPDEN